MEAQRGEEAPRNWMEALTSGSETRRNICYPVLKVKAFWEASSENRGSEPAVAIPKEPGGKHANGKGKASQKVTRGSSLFLPNEAAFCGLFSFLGNWWGTVISKPRKVCV